MEPLIMPGRTASRRREQLIMRLKDRRRKRERIGRQHFDVLRLQVRDAANGLIAYARMNAQLQQRKIRCTCAGPNCPETTEQAAC